MLRRSVVKILLLSVTFSITLIAADHAFANQTAVAKRLWKYDVLKLDANSAASQIRHTGKFSLKTSQRVFDLQLVPHDLRSSDYRSQVIGSDGVARELPRNPVNTYKGFVSGMKSTQVRLTITNDSVEGVILTANGHYFIQPARSLSKTARKDEFIFYNSEDVTYDPDMRSLTLADQVAVEQERASAYVDKSTGQITSTNIVAPSPPKVVRLATEADAEYVAALGGATQANNHILSIMNQVDGIFQLELGITFQIVFQNTWTNAATDPYTSLEPFAPLGEFRTYWNANFGHIQRDLAHFWSGKDLVVPGAADQAVVCQHPSSAYGFSGRVPNNPANPITSGTIGLTAHEMGHNFGAIHPFIPSVPPEIASNCGNSIMSGGSVTTFCDYSRSEMLGYISTFATCLPGSTTSPTHPSCVDVPIVLGVAVNGTLSPTDCRSPVRGMNHFADRYSFDGQAGQRLVITMNSGSPGLESYVFLIGPDGYVVGQDVFNGGGNSARLPFSGSLTLPFTGKYIVEATSNGLQQTGNYALNIALEGCVLTINPTSQHFGSNGGAGTINITATGSNCGAAYQFTVWPNPSPWLLPRTLNGAGTQVMEFTVDPNSKVAGRRAFLLIGASLGGQMGGLSIPITQSGSGADCPLTPIAFGETINGALSNTDCRSPISGADFDFADRYVFNATAGQEVVVLASIAGNFTSNVTLIGPTGRILLAGVLAEFFHTRIPGGKGTLKLGLAGQYVIEVTAALPGISGPYTLTLLNDAPPTLLAEESSDNAIALQSVSMLRGPFPPTTPFNLSPDQQTRIMLIADNLAVLPGENQSAVTAIVEDSQLNAYPLTVEFFGKMPGFGRLTQIVAKLPPNLPPGQELQVKVTVRGKTSNKVRFRIKSP